MTVQHIENIRDLLVHTIGRDLADAVASGRLRSRYPALSLDEATVAWVLDGMTRHSLDLLMKLREGEGWQ
jgi:hypothetical protein